MIAAAGERRVASGAFAAERMADRVAEETADELRRKHERERSIRTNAMGPGAFLDSGNAHGGGAGGGGHVPGLSVSQARSPVGNRHMSSVSYVQGALREVMSDYSAAPTSMRVRRLFAPFWVAFQSFFLHLKANKTISFTRLSVDLARVWLAESAVSAVAHLTATPRNRLLPSTVRIRVSAQAACHRFRMQQLRVNA